MGISVIILAAGKGTRMKSDLPKVLHKLAGEPLLAHVMHAALPLKPNNLTVVTGPAMPEVALAVKQCTDSAHMVVQKDRLGTGHAVLAALKESPPPNDDTVLVLYGDTPLITTEMLQDVVKASQKHDVVVLGMTPPEPTGYGRLICSDGLTLDRIVEEKDATAKEKAVTFCNSGIIAAKASLMQELLPKLSNDNASGEYYLTDLPELAKAEGVTSVCVKGEYDQLLGVNSRSQLAQAEQTIQTRLREQAMAQGTTLISPEHIFLCRDTKLGADVVIHPFVTFYPGVSVEGGATIHSFSHLESCHVHSGATIGPYARLRPGADIGEGARIGNFVEVKQSQVGQQAKINHLSYVGDATIGSKANLGAGTITCNYDGFVKSHTHIGNDSFIGSNTALVAPVNVGAGAIVAAGSVVVEDVEGDAMAIARSTQVNLRNKAKQFKTARKKPSYDN